MRTSAATFALSVENHSASSALPAVTRASVPLPTASRQGESMQRLRRDRCAVRTGLLPQVRAGPWLGRRAVWIAERGEDALNRAGKSVAGWWPAVQPASVRSRVARSEFAVQPSPHHFFGGRAAHCVHQTPARLRVFGSPWIAGNAVKKGPVGELLTGTAMHTEIVHQPLNALLVHVETAPEAVPSARGTWGAASNGTVRAMRSSLQAHGQRRVAQHPCGRDRAPGGGGGAAVVHRLGVYRTAQGT